MNEVDHFNFPGSYWSNDLATLGGCLGIAMGSVIVALTIIIVVVVSIILWLLGYGYISKIILLITSVIGVLLFFIINSIFKDKKKPEKDEREKYTYVKSALATYPDSKPKTIQYTVTNPNSKYNTFLYELDPHGKYKSQIILDGKIGIDVFNHDNLHLIVNKVTPIDFLDWQNKYWLNLPIDTDAVEITIEGFAYPDTPRADFYYTVYMVLDYQNNSDRLAKYPEPISKIFETEEKFAQKPIWWPSEGELMKITIDSHPSRFYPKLTEFIKPQESSDPPAKRSAKIYITNDESQLYLLLNFGRYWIS
ncbi:MAG: hypothetical protein KF816_17200 [Melioribacteraceae bacterium]|nr:hypothetical protein [Melioribacteraceae bacterium]